MVETFGPTFDQLHVISDLHMGGERGFQIFRRTQELSALIRSIRPRGGDGSVALLINGDMVDFLAERDARCFDPYKAADKVRRISRDPAFAPVWQELRAFASTARCRLILNLGNHDLELALPWVRDAMIDTLVDGKDASRGRVTVLTDGTGFQCTVGEKRILCLHGNEVDTWNVADHEMIRRIARDIVQGRTVAEWTPNAGSRLVIDVMNDLKRSHPFVDLLKPEVQAVVPVLLAMDEAVAPRLQRITAVAVRLTWDKIRRSTGFLSQGEQFAPTALELEEAGSWGRRERTAAAAGAGTAPVPLPTESRVLLANAEEYFRQGVDPMLLLDAGSTDQLGVGTASWAWARGRTRDEILYEAVRDLERDRSFAVHEPDETFRRIDKYVGAEFDVIATGHTHMEKQLPRGGGRQGTYFNTGSWVPRIRFTPEMLASPGAFRPIVDALRSGSTIDDLEAHEGLVINRPVVLSVCSGHDGTETRLEAVGLSRGKATRSPLGLK